MTEPATSAEDPPGRGGAGREAEEPGRLEPRGAPGLGLMLPGGGARAAYQVGVLGYMAERIPDLRFPILTGISAGAINIGFLASHGPNFRDAAEHLRRKWCSLTTEEVFRSDPPSLLSIGFRWVLSLISGGIRLAPRARSLVDTKPLREFLARSIDADGIRRNLDQGHLTSVALSALSFQTGRTVTFVAGRPPRRRSDSVHHRIVCGPVTIDHILASAAIPIVFPAVKIGQQYYGDGSFRFTAPLSPAIHLGAERILAISARYGRTTDEARQPEILGYPPPARIIGLIFNSVFLDPLDWDAARLQRINRLIQFCPADHRRQEELRRVELLVLRPSLDLGQLAAEYEGRLPRTLRFFVRGLGTPESRSSDFLSYLLFESAYISRLIELGYEDAKKTWSRIERFVLSGDRAAAG